MGSNPGKFVFKLRFKHARLRWASMTEDELGSLGCLVAQGAGDGIFMVRPAVSVALDYFLTQSCIFYW